MTRHKIIQRLQQLRGLFAAMERGEDPEGYTPALDQALVELTAPTGVHRPIQDVSDPIPPDPAAPSPAFRVGVNEADETDPHLRMQAAPSSPSVEDAKLLHIARMMALTKEPSATKAQAAGESLDALIAAERAERTAELTRWQTVAYGHADDAQRLAGELVAYERLINADGSLTTHEDILDELTEAMHFHRMAPEIDAYEQRAIRAEAALAALRAERAQGTPPEAKSRRQG